MIFDFTKKDSIPGIIGFTRRRRGQGWGGAVFVEPGEVQMLLVSSPPTVFAPTVTPGSLTVVLPLVSAAPTVFTPKVTLGLLQETGDSLLLETGDHWLTESGVASSITALTENTTPASTDLVLMVDDPGGSPASQKMTLANLRTYLLG